MPVIENFNCEGLCCQKHCWKPYTHFIEIKFKNMIIILGFCKECYKTLIEPNKIEVERT